MAEISKLMQGGTETFEQQINQCQNARKIQNSGQNINSQAENMT